MNRIRLIAAGALLLLLSAPAVAQAIPHWEVKTPGLWHVLPLGQNETVKESGSIAVTGATNYSSTYNFKDGCTITGTMTIFNPTTGARGGDLEWPPMVITCPVNGNAPEPCVAGEAYKFTQVTEWPSLLRALGTKDEFKGVGLEVECATSGAKEFAPSVTGSWSPGLGINTFTFAAASGTFESLGTEFVFLGKVKLTPTAFAFVRG
jgi:hypothetical protein